jgi:hypothetical protein
MIGHETVDLAIQNGFGNLAAIAETDSAGSSNEAA